MKQDNNLSEEDLLQQWKVNEPLPARFQQNVWNRIARAEVKAEQHGWLNWAQSLLAPLQQPKLAYSMAVILLALGIAAGSWTAQVKSRHYEKELGRRYLQTLDPYQKEFASR